MGLRGPAPRPSALSRAEGNPGHRAINRQEPQPALTRPKMPKHLGSRARKEWKRLVPILERMKVLTEADGTALANVCFETAELYRAQEALEQTGPLIKNKETGMVHLNPLFGAVVTLSNRVTQGLREFGLTPASRSRIKTAESAKSDDLVALLRAPRAAEPKSVVQ